MTDAWSKEAVLAYTPKNEGGLNRQVGVVEHGERHGNCGIGRAAEI